MSLILFHSSKTMQLSPHETRLLRQPALIAKSTELAEYLKTLSLAEIAKSMHVSNKTADRTFQLIHEWNIDPKNQSPAIDSFLGDMYSGLQAPLLSADDREYADTYLRILSGLYGILRPLDGIMLYRLEMGYKLQRLPFNNLYSYWTESIIDQLPDCPIVFNLSSTEYTKNILPHLANRTVITPQFLTVNSSTGNPRQVVVHSKIARGAYVRWLIQNRVSSPEDAVSFDLLSYSYDKTLSTSTQPVFVCNEFRGTGLSIRPTQNR